VATAVQTAAVSLQMGALAQQQGVAIEYINKQCGMCGPSQFRHPCDAPVPRPFACVPVYAMAQRPAVRLRMLAGSGSAKLAVLLLQRRDSKDRMEASFCRMMQAIVRRVAAGRVAETPEGLFRDGCLLCASRRFPAAAQKIEAAIALGHVSSHAELAWILMRNGDQGVPLDAERAFLSAQAGRRLGCLHSSGVLACCYAEGCGCETNYALAMQLACESEAAGCRYGQYAVGSLYDDPVKNGIQLSFTTAAEQYRLAAAQQLDVAQWKLGFIYSFGSHEIHRDDREALHWYTQAADQGHSSSCFQVGLHYEEGRGVPVDVVEAVCWYKHALAGGVAKASGALRRLRA
jgi:TPR repeat protein